ncbi:MAG: flippase [Gemmatimonadota bacterium]
MKLVVRNSAFNLAGQGITLLAGLISIPIAFRHLGTERFGLLTLVWGMLSYAVVFDLGTGPAVARATAASLVQDQGARIGAIVRAGMSIQIGLGVAAAAGLVLFATLLIRLLNIPVAFQRETILAIYALAAGLPVILMAQSQQAVLEGLERFDLIAYIRTPVAVAAYAIPAYGAIVGWSVARIVVLVLASRVVAMILFYVMYLVVLPPAQNGAMREELRALFRYSRWLALSGVLTQLLIYLDRFVLSATSGLHAVAQYTAPYDAATKLLILPGSIGVAMFPGMAKDAARDRASDAKARSKAAGRTIMLIMLPICILLIAFAGPLLRLWLGPQLTSEGVNAFRILVLATFFHAAAYPPVILIEALGRSDVVARYYLLELAGYTPIMLFAIMRFGVAGAAGAWAVRTAALMLWSHWYVNRERHDTTRVHHLARI